MIKKTLFVGAAVLLLVTLFAGSGMVSYVSTAFNKVEDQFKQNVPVKFEIQRAREMLVKLQPEIKKNMHMIAREEVELAKLERQLGDSETKLAKSREDILRLKTDLESGNSHFVYAGRSYSATDVKNDLANRFEHHRTMEGTVDQLQQVLRARQNGLTAAREKLEGMLAAKRQLAVDIENLAARQKMIEVAETTSQFNFDDSQLSRTRDLVNEIGTRLDVTEKLMNQHVELSDRIPLDGEDAGSEDVLDSITRHFSDDGAESLANSDTH